MKRKRYTEEQIISILKDHEAGASVPRMQGQYRRVSQWGLWSFQAEQVG